MSLTHQDISQLVNEHLVKIAEEHDCSVGSVIGGVALSTIILMEGAEVEALEIGNFTLTLSENETQPTTK